MQKIKQCIFIFLYGSNHNEYNTIADTFCVPFCAIQFTRLLSLLALIVLTVCEFYVVLG